MSVALVTGANRGIGLEVVRQLVELGHTVYLGARDERTGRGAAEESGAHFVQLDVTDDASPRAALAVIEAEAGHLDILINNAGVLGGVDDALRVFDTNAVGLIRVTEAALPALRASSRPVVVTVSSSMGSFWAVTNPERPEHTVPEPIYGASKAAATMLTVQYAKSNPGITFNAIEPGYTATDMTVEMGGGRSAVDSARAVVRLALLGPDGPTGTLQDGAREDLGTLPW